jgi:hypothetical protein
MTFGEIYDPIRGRIDCPAEIKPKSDRLVVDMHSHALAILCLRQCLVLRSLKPSTPNR